MSYRRSSRRVGSVAAVVAATAGVTLGVLPSSSAAALDPFRSYARLPMSNGFAAASFNRETHRIDTFLEHVYRYYEPRTDDVDLCFEADESRNLAYDAYFGVRSGATGTWLTDVSLTTAGYVTGTGVVRTDQTIGDLDVTTWNFMPMGIDEPVLVMALRVQNRGTSSLDVSPYALFNFHLGAAGGGRSPSAIDEEVSWDAARSTFYEWGPSLGTIAYVALSPLAHHTASLGSAGVYSTLLAGGDLDDVGGTSAPVYDVAPGFQGPTETLGAGDAAWMAVATVWALDEDAAPDVDALLAWQDGRAPLALVEDELAAWEDWHTGVPTGLDAVESEVWLQSMAVLRMAQVRETGSGHGQIVASLPSGFGDPATEWNIAWVRDMAYATVALARAGHLDEARDALWFQLMAPAGRHELEVGSPYRISVARYFGNGAEESDCNEHGPNIEFDGFGLFLWSVGEWLRAGGDASDLAPYWGVARNEIAGVLASLIESGGLVRADSSIWEVHWNGQQKHFAYTSLAAARGLCDAAVFADALGHGDEAVAWSELSRTVRDAVLSTLVDGDGVLAQSLEDLTTGSGYYDGAVVEALNWGVADTTGIVGGLTVTRLVDVLAVPSAMGWMRNDDGASYDSQEWSLIDLRFVPALRATGSTDAANDTVHWIAGQAAANDLQIPELFDATSGAYAGSAPMAGFGAGAFALAVDGVSTPPVCPVFEPTPIDEDAGVTADAGTTDAGSIGVDSGSGTDGGAGSTDAGTGGDGSTTPARRRKVSGCAVATVGDPTRAAVTSWAALLAVALVFTGRLGRLRGRPRR